jgi:hypothetical protein
LGDPDVSGSYCVKTGTDFDPNANSESLCGMEQSCAEAPPALMAALLPQGSDVRSVIRLDQDLADPCIPVVDKASQGRAICIVTEAFNSDRADECSCQTAPGRIMAEPNTIDPDLRQRYNCFCEIVELDPPSARACQQDPALSSPSGWCYVDELDLGGKPITSACPPTLRQSIRLRGIDPRPGGMVRVRCQSHAADLVPPSPYDCSTSP